PPTTRTWNNRRRFIPGRHQPPDALRAARCEARSRTGCAVAVSGPRMHLPGALRALVSRLSRRRGFLALTIAVLGLGLGAALTVLEVADALFWRPLPYADAERLVFAWQVDSRGTRLTVTGADFLSWADEDGPFTAMAALSARGFNLASDGEPE